jgi:hypothetical protein
LSDELGQAGIPWEVTVPVIYKGNTLPLGFRARRAESDLLQNEPNSRLSADELHAIRLKDGLRRFVI